MIEFLRVALVAGVEKDTTIARKILSMLDRIENGDIIDLRDYCKLVIWIGYHFPYIHNNLPYGKNGEVVATHMWIECSTYAVDMKVRY